MPERRADITVTVVQEKGELIFSYASGHKRPNGKLTFDNVRRDDWYRMAFWLEDGGLGLKFFSKPAQAGRPREDAFWVSRTGCPETPSYDDQFPRQNVHQDGKLLVVKNLNSQVAEYHFALRVVRPDGVVERDDPVIDNRNGGVRSDAIVVGATVALVAGVGLALLALLGRGGRGPRR